MKNFTEVATLNASGGFFYVKPICCLYQNLCMTFTNILGFLLNFSTSWKSCVKRQWPKKSLFQKCWFNVMLCDSTWVKVKKSVEYLYSLKSWYIYDWVHKGHPKLNMFPVFSKQIKSLKVPGHKIILWWNKFTCSVYM